jgi:plastocyanin
MNSKIIIVLILVVVLGGGAALLSRKQTAPVSTATTSSATAGEPNTITIKDYAFTPATLTVKTGTVITWVNKDLARHTITADTPSSNAPASAFIGQDANYTFTAGAPGTYTYHCEPHPYMKAIIIVTQ